MSSSSVAAVVTRRATTATRATIRGSPRFTSPLLEKPSLHEAYPSESSDTVACAGSVVCHYAPTLRGLSEQLGPGLWAPFPPSVPPSLQTDVDPAHLSSLAQPPSIMGFFFFSSKQGASKREYSEMGCSRPQLHLQAPSCTNLLFRDAS